MSTFYTYSEARQNFAALLDLAAMESEVRIQRRDGLTFVIKSEPITQSPLDVEGLDLNLSVDQIVDYVHEGRREN